MDEYYWADYVLPLIEFIRDHPRKNITEIERAFYDEKSEFWKYSKPTISAMLKTLCALGVLGCYNTHPFETKITEKGKRLIVVMKAKFELRYERID